MDIQSIINAVGDSPVVQRWISRLKERGREYEDYMARAQEPYSSMGPEERQKDTEFMMSHNMAGGLQPVGGTAALTAADAAKNVLNRPVQMTGPELQAFNASRDATKGMYVNKESVEAGRQSLGELYQKFFHEELPHNLDMAITYLQKIANRGAMNL